MVVSSLNSKSFEFHRFLESLDRLSLLLGSLITEETYVDISTLNSRYYIALHDVLIPLAIRDGAISIPKAFLIPSSTIYVHEQKIYAIQRLKLNYRILDANTLMYLPAVDLTSSENLLILASSALAFKASLTPSEKNLLRIMPNNIRTYMEAALKILESGTESKVEEYTTNNSQGPVIMELVLWVNESKNSDILEVRYVKGITMRIFKIIYQDHEIDIKTQYSFSSRFVARLASFLPSNILAAISNNIESAYKIISTYIALSK